MPININNGKRQDRTGYQALTKYLEFLMKYAKRRTNQGQNSSTFSY